MLSQYIENDLDAETMIQITSHIKECILCQTTMKRLETAIKFIRSLEESPPLRNYVKNVDDRHKKT
jgi:hypothetical protein